MCSAKAQYKPDPGPVTPRQGLIPQPLLNRALTQRVPGLSSLKIASADPSAALRIPPG